MTVIAPGNPVNTAPVTVGEASIRLASIAHTEAICRDLIARLSAEFSAQLYCIGLELRQTQTLLSDAIATLTTSFTAIHTALEPSPPFVAREAGALFLRNVRAILTEDLNTAVRSLQFQDLTQQLLDHIKSRVVEMEAVLREIDAASQSPCDFDAFLAACGDAVRRHEVIADVRPENPVSQGHVAAGDITLF